MKDASSRGDQQDHSPIVELDVAGPGGDPPPAEPEDAIASERDKERGEGENAEKGEFREVDMRPRRGRDLAGEGEGGEEKVDE